MSINFPRKHKINKKKFAFLLHEPVLMSHYKDVWKAMDPSDFTIILTENFYFGENGNAKLGVSGFK